jgi:hypothetical protein
MNAWIDPQADIQAFYDMVWNVDTAQGVGLDFWGKVVVIERAIKIPRTTDVFGFEVSSTTQSFQPFNQAPFSGTNTKFSYYTLQDDAYRTLIMIKAMINILYATAPAINNLLSKLFEGRGRCYYLTLGDMHARYVFEFYLQPFERALLLNNQFLPNPTGVDLDFREVVPAETFGFKEAINFQPFNQGAFSYRD